VSFGQNKTFTWQDELCEYRGSYDSKKYTEQQLTDTYKLVNGYELGLNYNAAVFRLDAIPELDVNELDREYKEKRQIILSLKIINSPYWEAVRKAKLSELEQYYALSRPTLLAYTEPKNLKDYKGAEECKIKFAEPIMAGGSKLLTAWRKQNEIARTRNGDPERVRKEFEAQLASPRKYEYARLEMLTFGWWNCVNATIVQDTGSQDGTHQKQFAKLFKKVTSKCDEP
jgi:hypothetical protein